MSDTPSLGNANWEWESRAERVIPGGCSTGSKRPEALYGTQYGGQDGIQHNTHPLDGGLPTHFEKAEGCTVWTTDGRSLLDLGMALGAVGIGYADPAVTRAVQQTAAAGNVATLTHRSEVEAAERLVQVIPCAEKVRFLRTGAEAVAAAVRIARTLTGRERVIASGYFGWLDWSSDSSGVPKVVRDATTWIPFNDVDALQHAVTNGDAPAAIVIEPLVHEVASLAWLRSARSAADSVGAVLVFDEVKTAFRVKTGGVQELRGIVPDIATLGKALANGYPLSAVVGRAEVMDAAKRTWISSTAASETTGIAAALAVLDRHSSEDVCGEMARNGQALKRVVSDSLASAGWLNLEALGPSVMWRLESDNALALDAFVAAAIHHGVIFKRGAYQFGAVAHSARSIEQLRVLMPDILATTERLLLRATR